MGRRAVTNNPAYRATDEDDADSIVDEEGNISPYAVSEIGEASDTAPSVTEPVREERDICNLAGGTYSNVNSDIPISGMWM